MHKTVYIDPEEEITSIISKIRDEASDEIYLVVPKNAILVQGVINLEILRREMQRLNKSIIFVANDKQVKGLLERLELDVREGLDGEFEDGEVKIEEEAMLSKTVSETMREAGELKKARRIGSNSFYDSENEDISTDEIKKALLKNENNVVSGNELIRENSWQKNEKINTATRKISPRQARKILRKHNPSRIRARSSMSDNRAEVSFQNKADPRFAIRQKEAEEFFSVEHQQQDSVSEISSVKKEKTPKNGRTLKWLLGLIIVILALGALGSWTFVNLPRVMVSVFLRAEETDKALTVLAYPDAGGNWNENEVFGSAEELELVHELRFDASGEKFSSDKGKARGKVRIVNNYSSSDQPLVATSRLLSENGKLFRLLEGVTVPGMKDGNPGEVQAKIIADEPGADYNIDPTKFTIEGFKGNSKYEKFEVVSDAKTEGGLDNVDNQKVKVVTQGDIEGARVKVVDSFNSAIENKIKEKIGGGKVFLVDSIEKEISESVSSAEVGDIADQFTFTLKQKVKVITFYEDDVKNLAMKKIEEETKEGYELDGNSIELEYDKGKADFENQKLQFDVIIRANLWPRINQEEVKNGVARKDEEEIREFLQGYPQIKKAEIEFSPAGLNFLPITPRKIIIEEIK